MLYFSEKGYIQSPEDDEAPGQVHLNRQVCMPAVQAWIERGDCVCVYQNHDLGHYDLGKVIAMPAPPEGAAKMAADAEEGKHLCAPDTAIGLGWRYKLIAICDKMEDFHFTMPKEATVS